ncbi:TetR/AcrR family transcriptional regulator [Streptosporangium sp. KLBMP 9127]|nr:TetR/AcrR family transcriptional regulator [Streptosporangium sp. KLBMP 9127]
MARQRTFDRNLALERALVTFWEHGYEATSIAALTTAMDIRPPSLYAAFGDKRQLFQEAVAHYQQTYGAFTERALAEEPSGRSAIKRILEEAATEYSDDGHPHGCLIISGGVNYGPESAEVAAWLRTFRDRAKAGLKARIDADIAAGLLPADTDARALATFYASVIQGMSAQARDGASKQELGRVAELAMRAWPAPA